VSDRHPRRRPAGYAAAHRGSGVAAAGRPL